MDFRQRFARREITFAQGLNGIGITVTIHVSKTLATSYYRHPAYYKFHCLSQPQVMYGSFIWLFYVISCKCCSATTEYLTSPSPLALMASCLRSNKPIVLLENM